MKTKLLAFLLLVTVTQLFSQRFREVVKWEISTANGGLIVGAAMNEAMADAMISDFTDRNKKLTYKAKSHEKKYTTIKVQKKTDDPLDQLKKQTKRGYIVISPEQLNVLENRKGKHLPEIAVAYSEVANIGFTKAMEDLKLILKYRIKNLQSTQIDGIVSN